eukprot:TRINITY_DN6092_c0_g1_i2.p4 TRINITY_DN6092_c0_g1~~TRINITY_DN6092_c0_g1_i2.p4  ORF type:complete len:108 (-),score=25.12 TRINITY_DN6092_c0_g1_i2:467-790(-)
MTPQDRGEKLGLDPGLEEIHSIVASEGQTQAPAATDKVEYHFVAFVVSDGHLFELDGVKAFPINHGPTSQESFLNDAAAVIQSQFFARAKETDDVHFSVITLGPAQQ